MKYKEAFHLQGSLNGLNEFALAVKPVHLKGMGAFTIHIRFLCVCAGSASYMKIIYNTG